MILLLLVPAAAFAHWRAGPASFDMSVADVALVAATPAAVALVPWRSRHLWRLLAALLVYLALLLITVAATPSLRTVLELAHRLFLVGGAAVIGAALAQQGRAVLALRIFNLVAVAFAVAAVVDTATSGFAPAYPVGTHKNAAGMLLGVAVFLRLVTPRVAYALRGWRAPTTLTLVAGLLATQSRGAMLALTACLGLWAIRQRGLRRSGLIIVGMVVAVLAVVYLVNARETDRVRADPSAARFTGAATREHNVGLALDQWREHPVTGAGLRYFVDAGEPEPHNVVASNLAESGLVGTVALGVLLAGAVRALSGRRGAMATAARYVLLLQFLAALFDIYWRAGTGSLPWLIVGIALIDADPAERQQKTGESKPEARHPVPWIRDDGGL